MKQLNFIIDKYYDKAPETKKIAVGVIFYILYYNLLILKFFDHLISKFFSDIVLRIKKVDQVMGTIK